MRSRSEKIEVVLHDPKAGTIRHTDMQMHIGLRGNEEDPALMYLAIYDKKGLRLDIPLQRIIDKYQEETSNGT